MKAARSLLLRAVESLDDAGPSQENLRQYSTNDILLYLRHVANDRLQKCYSNRKAL